MIRHIRNGCKIDAIKPLQQCTICSKTFHFTCWLKDHIKMHTKTEVQICSVCRYNSEKNNFQKKHQTECNSRNSNNKNISSKNHNETNNEEFVSSFAF